MPVGSEENAISGRGLGGKRNEVVSVRFKGPYTIPTAAWRTSRKPQDLERKAGDDGGYFTVRIAGDCHSRI